MMNITELTVHELQEKLKNKELTVTEITKAYVDRINEKGSICINKFLAYLALCNSATDLWEDFNIDNCIVVNDFENIINGTVDYIDDKTYEINRVTKDLEFTQTDGVGMILPELTDRNFMVRLPWIKGLLAKFDFVRFINEHNASGKVTVRNTIL